MSSFVVVMKLQYMMVGGCWLVVWRFSLVPCDMNGFQVIQIKNRGESYLFFTGYIIYPVSYVLIGIPFRLCKDVRI